MDPRLPGLRITTEKLSSLEETPWKRTTQDILDLVNDHRILMAHLHVYELEKTDLNRRLGITKGYLHNLIEFVEKHFDPEFPTQLPLHELRRRYELIKGSFDR